MAELVDGKNIALKMREKVAREVSSLRRRSKKAPLLVSVIVGADESSRLYGEMQKKAAAKAGIEFKLLELGKKSGEKSIINTIQRLNKDKKVTAIMVEQPLPKGVNTEKVISAISPLKDAEGIHPANLGRLFYGDGGLVPCTPGAVMTILDELKTDLYGKNVVIVGHSSIVGKPLSMMMLARTATTSVCHIGTAEKGDICHYTRAADVLVVAVGKPALVKGDWVKEGAIVIDVGINRTSGKVTGDVDHDGVFPKASVITPVPGGVGPVTVSVLLKNVMKAYGMQHE